jgi:uncharacterized membrane protein
VAWLGRQGKRKAEIGDLRCERIETEAYGEAVSAYISPDRSRSRDGVLAQSRLAAKLALTAGLAATTTVATMLIQIPIPPTRGYLNFGEILVFTSALLFGRFVGGLAGGIGSAVADIITGYAYFSPYTLIIKGLEGFLAGAIRDGKSTRRDVLGWFVGAVAMVTGYFLVESYVMGFGVPAALIEVPSNAVQVISGAIIAIPLARGLRNRIPKILV